MADIRGYRLPPLYRVDLTHIQQVAGLAERLVTQRVGTRLCRTEIVVTTGVSASDLVIDAHRGMFGHQPAIWSLKGEYRACCGATAITQSGVLVVINADRCQPRTVLNETLVHELAHAAQLSRPGARDAATRNLRNNYGIERMSGREARAAYRLVAADEREAEGLERFSSELPA